MINAKETFAGFHDAELLLLSIMLESGLRLRPTEAVRDAEAALALEQTFRVLVGEELARRELDVSRAVPRLIERVLARIPEDL